MHEVPEQREGNDRGKARNDAFTKVPDCIWPLKSAFGGFTETIEKILRSEVKDVDSR